MSRLDFTERQLELMTCEMKDKICAIVEDVEYKVRVRFLSLTNNAKSERYMSVNFAIRFT